ncbi:MAG: transposase, partial [Raoultibacter sp.]
MPEAFGGTGAGAKAPTAQASFLYDPLNDIIVDAKLAPLSTDERTLAKEHLMALRRLTSLKKKLLLFDRGHPSSDLIAALQASHCDFLLRVRSKFSIDLDALDMGVHPFDFPCDYGNTIPLVAVKLALDSGETEMLLTSIQDKRMGAKAFKELYFARWGMEIRINDLKHKVEIENFSSRLESNLYQDFYASVQLHNLVA